MQNKVSVIIPVYNVEKYLEECVNSVISQSYKNIEIIVVNDGSTDNSLHICQKLSQHDDRIIIINQKNGGLSCARNTGLKYASGKYITFIDSDDKISKCMISQLVDIAVRNNADIVGGRITSDNTQLESKKTRKPIAINREKALKLILQEKEFTTSACCKLYLKSLWEKITFPEGKIFEDYATIYKVVQNSLRILYIDTPLYYYRINLEGITRSPFNNKRMQYFEITEEFQLFIKKEYPQLIKYLDNRTTRYAISFFRQIACSSEPFEQEKEKIVSIIKKNIIHYLHSRYNFFSKLYGILICISPTIALKVFKKR